MYNSSLGIQDQGCGTPHSHPTLRRFSPQSRLCTTFIMRGTSNIAAKGHPLSKRISTNIEHVEQGLLVNPVEPPLIKIPIPSHSMATASFSNALISFTVSHIYLCVATLLSTALLSYYVLTYDKRRNRLPPKIPAWPIINHTFLQQEDNTPPILRAWGEQYGEVFRTRAGTTDFIWLNSKEAVKELFDRRSAIYSSRQPMPMAFDCAT